MANSNARSLRRNATDIERQLWKMLRGRRLEGFKFRRQHPIGPYIADFALVSARLVIEADGGQHCESASDIRRTAWLESDGWRVVRFWNNETRDYPEYIVETILQALRDRSSRE